VPQEGEFPYLETQFELIFARIGAAICRALAKHPLKGIALHYSRSTKEVEDLRDDLTTLYPSLKLTLHQADLTKSDECQTLTAEVLKAHGKVDVFVSNAGGARRVTNILYRAFHCLLIVEMLLSRTLKGLLISTYARLFSSSKVSLSPCRNKSGGELSSYPVLRRMEAESTVRTTHPAREV